MAKENMFAKASKKRSEELGETVVAVETGTKPAKKEQIADARTVLSLSISVSDKKKLQQKALDEGTTAAKLISKWINENC